MLVVTSDTIVLTLNVMTISQKYISVRNNNLLIIFSVPVCANLSHVTMFAFRNLYFYCVNTSYPMDNCFTGQRDRSRQTTEKVILYRIPAGPVTECIFARCRLVHTSCLDRMTSRRLFLSALSVYGRVFYCVKEHLIL